jgi:hypothetical protein
MSSKIGTGENAYHHLKILLENVTGSNVLRAVLISMKRFKSYSL